MDFHEWIGDQWAVLFSHPEDYTPVCTTELGAFAKLEPEFTKRGVKLIGLSANTIESHGGYVLLPKVLPRVAVLLIFPVTQMDQGHRRDFRQSTTIPHHR